MKILVADDDPINRRLLQAFLAKGDYEVILARDGEEAWSVLRQVDSPKLAILDWSMPGMDGTEVCRELRKQRDKPYVYVILLTSMSLETEVIAGLDAGADDHALKPQIEHVMQVHIAQQHADYGLNAKDNAGRVRVVAVVQVRGAAGLFRWDQARRSASG